MAADGSVSDGGEGGGEAAVDPAFLEVPERRNDLVLVPLNFFYSPFRHRHNKLASIWSIA